MKFLKNKYSKKKKNVEYRRDFWRSKNIYKNENFKPPRRYESVTHSSSLSQDGKEISILRAGTNI